MRERFTREALAVARLSGNPNIVTIYDVGEHGERPFIVMEYLAGGSLEQKIRAEGAQSPRQALEWLEQAANALDAAHREGIVHRDVKPANLLLDRYGHVHVADFGIASAAGLGSLTQTGTVLGTASYLSPEQAQGERTTAASDLYSLGIVAFELLTGRRPFEGDSVAAEAAAHVTASCRRCASVNPALPVRARPGVRAGAREGSRRDASAARPSSSPRCATRSRRRPARRAIVAPARAARPPRRRARSRRGASLPALPLLVCSRPAPAAASRARCSPAGTRSKRSTPLDRRPHDDRQRRPSTTTPPTTASDDDAAADRSGRAERPGVRR